CPRGGPGCGGLFLRPWAGPAVHRRAKYLSYRPPRGGLAAKARHFLHHRADDQSRQAACEDPLRRLDRRDPRPLAVGTVRALGRRHRHGRRDLHVVGATRREAAGVTLFGSLASAAAEDSVTNLPYSNWAAGP